MSTFDRRVPDELAEIFKPPDGGLRDLTRLALDPQYREKALELYFRGYEDKSRNSRATLYLGTTRVVHVWFNPLRHQFELEGQPGPSFTRESLPV